MTNINPKASSELKSRTKHVYQKILDRDATKRISYSIKQN